MLHEQKMTVPAAAKHYALMTLSATVGKEDSLVALLADKGDGGDVVLFQYLGNWWTGFRGGLNEFPAPLIVKWFERQRKHVAPALALTEMSINVEALTGPELRRGIQCAKDAMVHLNASVEENHRALVEVKLMIAKCETMLKDAAEFRKTSLASHIDSRSERAEAEAEAEKERWLADR